MRFVWGHLLATYEPVFGVTLACGPDRSSRAFSPGVLANRAALAHLLACPRQEARPGQNVRCRIGWSRGHRHLG
jgi:hypothetical protein